MQAAQSVGPVQRLHQLTRQSEREVEAAHPGTGQRQPGSEGLERVEALRRTQLQHRAAQLPGGQRDGLAAGGAAGEVHADQQGQGHVGLPGRAEDRRAASAGSERRARGGLGMLRFCPRPAKAPATVPAPPLPASTVSTVQPDLVHALRGGIVESFHRGALAVVDGDGALVLALGDVDRPGVPAQRLQGSCRPCRWWPAARPMPWA